MSYFRAAFSQNLRHCVKNYFVSNFKNTRHFCEFASRVPTEKSVNNVTLLGRAGINPQLRGTETKPVVVFTLATNTNYKYDSGEFQQKTEWHRISVFKQHLREIVLQHLKKGSRIYLEGRIVYGEFSDSKGLMHNTTTIVANDIVFVGTGKKNELYPEDDDASL